MSPEQQSQLDLCEGVIRIDAAAIADAHLGVLAPGSIVLHRANGALRVLASGSTHEVEALDLPMPDHRVSLPDHVVMPGLVNAHTHLDLTHIGIHPHEPGDGFVSWVDMIRARRHTDDAQIADAVRLGIDKLLAGGTVAVGDIAGAPNGDMTLAPLRALADSSIIGVSYLEFFGIGTTKNRTHTRIESFIRDQYPAIVESLVGSHVRIGLQPHAPNTVDRSIYQMVAQRAESKIPLSTHLAETPEERQLIDTGEGPQRALLERLGVWNDTILDAIGQGKHPVAHLQPALEASRFLVAHVNDATDEAIAILAQTQTCVAYCPRASAYFGADTHFGPHRYRDMLDADVVVCLGTDSIVNLDTPDRVSVLDEMRLLHCRDGVEPSTLLAMATLNGARALGLDETEFSLRVDSTPRGLVGVRTDRHAVDRWDTAMRTNTPPTWVFAPQTDFP